MKKERERERKEKDTCVLRGKKEEKCFLWSRQSECPTLHGRSSPEAQMIGEENRKRKRKKKERKKKGKRRSNR